MTPQQTITAEWALLATMAQTNVWPGGVTEDLFAHPSARCALDWMQDAREQTGMWSPLAVGCWMENEGYDADAVDATVDLLVETAPIYAAENLPAVVGFLIEQKGRRAGKDERDIIIEKHAAGCALSEREIAALTETESENA